MSRKMTQEIRRAIVEAAKKHRFQEASEQLRQREIELGRRIYDASYSEKVRSLMDQLPNGILETDSNIWFFNDENKSLPAPQVAAVNALFGLPIDTPETDEAKEAA